MPARLLDGRALARELREDTIVRVERLRALGIAPRLTVVLAGDDAASHAYARSIERAGTAMQIDVTLDVHSTHITEAALCARLHELGDDPDVHGIILQQPLPAHLGVRRIAEAMPPHKDVDGTNPISLARIAYARDDTFVPATPMAVMLLLERSRHWPLRGVRCCVVGRSSVVGLPVSLLLLGHDATVTITHRGTRDLGRRTAEAEVLVAAAGVAGLIRGDMVAPGATVIDVGTNYVDGVAVGDVDFAGVAEVAGEITPVPGGVGPVTNVALLRNVVTAAERLIAP